MSMLRLQILDLAHLLLMNIEDGLYRLEQNI